MKSVHVQTVLVVDDDPEWLDFLSRAIGAQYPVLSATNGEDAVRRAQRACPDVIILDVMLYGGKDGFSTYAELLNDKKITADIIWEAESGPVSYPSWSVEQKKDLSRALAAVEAGASQSGRFLRPQRSSRAWP